MRRLSVAVIFGGVSSEYTVSLRSAVFILENLDKDRFEQVPVGITPDGRWFLYDGPYDLIAKDEWCVPEYTTHAIIPPDRGLKSLVALDGSDMFIPLDVVFPAVHGQNCEDGALQGLLRLAGIPFVGCDVMASALCMDKEFTHIVMERAGIKMAPYICLRRSERGGMDALRHRVRHEIGYPAFVKPANSGSSVGGSQVRDEEGLEEALDIAFKEDDKVLIEALISGQEVECAVFGNRETVAPLVGEIAAPDGFYDFEAKYINDSAGLYIPARIPEQGMVKIKETAMRIFELAGCRGLARVDFFYCPNGDVVFNEINTLPGFTSISMYPKLMMASGMSGVQLVSGLVDLALEPAENTVHG